LFAISRNTILNIVFKWPATGPYLEPNPSNPHYLTILVSSHIYVGNSLKCFYINVHVSFPHIPATCNLPLHVSRFDITSGMLSLLYHSISLVPRVCVGG
jgi:hypothetical protein